MSDKARREQRPHIDLAKRSATAKEHRMAALDLGQRATDHIQRFVGSLIDQGWQPVQIPEKGRLKRNRQLISFKTPSKTLNVRVCIYKVGGSGRAKPDERRVEITTTYRAGMERLPDYQDVGLDPRRLEYGGDTHNASSFLDSSGLEASRNDRLTVNPYPTTILGGVEYQAFFRPERLSEYLLNHSFIHDCLYLGDGLYSGAHVPSGTTGVITVPDSQAFGDLLILADNSKMRARRVPPPKLVEAFECQDYDAIQRAKLTPEEYEAIRRRCEENGALGEQLVLEYERKRMRRLGQPHLAERVTWVSRSSVGEGYDILSFNKTGAKRFIEVKSTIGTRNSFEMSYNEWSFAAANASSYGVYHVKKVRSNTPEIVEIGNPVPLEASGQVHKTPLGWRITLL